MARLRLEASQLGESWENFDPDAIAVERATEKRIKPLTISGASRNEKPEKL